MSDDGGGASIGILVGAGVGGCAIVVGIIALALYCYMKARKEKSNTNMTKSTDIFTTAASNTQTDYPPARSRVNQYPDPEAARKERKEQRRRDRGHENPAYVRHGSDSSSLSSDVEGRDISPARVRPRGGRVNEAFSSESSYEDSSSIDEEPIAGFSMEKEVSDRHDRRRSSYKKAKQADLLDSAAPNNGEGRFTRTGERRSRRDEFQRRNPRSDSPLTVDVLSKHEERTRRENEKWDDKSKSGKSRKRDSSPSSRTYESSVETGTSLGTDFTMTTVSSGQRFAKNPSLRRNSPSRSSSHRRYRKDNEKDEKGRRKPRRTRSSDRQHRSDRSRSPGGSQRSGRSRSGSASEAKRINKEQAMLPIFSQDPKGKKKSSAV